jgi:RNA polymerase sigma-70 factor (ECF subfamily)
MHDPDRKSCEEKWITGVQAGNEGAFEDMFDAFYRRLCAFAAGIVGSKDEARQVVHDVFLKIWQRRDEWTVRRSLKAYLYQATRNQALNYTERNDRRHAVEHTMDDTKKPVRKTEHTAADELRQTELAESIWAAIDRLPERRRTAFVLHRQHDMTYSDVAEVMGISKKTVEHQMGHALKALREELPPDLL